MMSGGIALKPTAVWLIQFDLFAPPAVTLTKRFFGKAAVVGVIVIALTAS